MTRQVCDQARKTPRTTSIHRLVVLAGRTFAAIVPFPAQAQELETAMQVYRSRAMPTAAPPEATFTGDVHLSGSFRRAAPSRLSGAIVTFAPGARTPWTVNPAGQTPVVTSGAGWAQCGGEAIVKIHAGDMIWCPPGERHWEGAAPDQAMTSVARQEDEVQFGDRVSDEEYRRGPSAP